jgi:hypothetical protein
MPIEFVRGDLFANRYKAQALAHGCNCQGSMGAGVAKGFRDRHPAMYEEYRRRCKAEPRRFNLGDAWLWKADGRQWVFNLGTQEGYWRARPSSTSGTAGITRSTHPRRAGPRQARGDEDLPPGPPSGAGRPKGPGRALVAARTRLVAQSRRRPGNLCRAASVVPHRAQRAALRQAFPALCIMDASTGLAVRSAIDTVERFQGGERTVILVSATESDRAYLLASSEFLLDPRRLTVALSRAKRKMVLVASRSVFSLFSPEEDVFANAQMWKNLLLRTYTTRLWAGDREGRRVEVWGGKS